MALRQILVQLGIEVDKNSETKARTGINKLKTAALAAGAAVAAIGVVKGIKNLVNEVAIAGDEIAKTSKQIGVAAEDLQELRFAANLAGASNADLTTGLRLLQKNALEAAQGTKSFQEDFAALNVRVTDGQGRIKSATQLLEEMGAGFQDLKTDTERTALAQTLLGRSGTKLIPLLTQGTDAIREQRARARQLGEVYDKDLREQSEALIDAQRELNGATSGLRVQLAAIFLPVVLRLTRAFTEFLIRIRPVTDFLKRNATLTVIALTAVVVTLTGAFALLAAAALSSAIATAAAWVSAAGPFVIIGTLIAALIALTALIIEDAFFFFTGQESLIGRVIEKWKLFKEAATDAIFDMFSDFTGISRAAFNEFVNLVSTTMGLALEPIATFFNAFGGLMAVALDFVVNFFTLGISEAFSLLFSNLTETASEFFGFFDRQWERVGKIFTSLGNLTGFAFDDAQGSTNPNRLVDATRAISRGNTTNFANTQRTIMNINVDASGADNPERVAQKTAASVRQVSENDMRQALGMFQTAMPTP